MSVNETLTLNLSWLFIFALRHGIN